MNPGKRIQNSIATLSKNLIDGLFQITHNGFALLGLAVVWAEGHQRVMMDRCLSKRSI